MRWSALAQAQTNFIVAALLQAHPDLQLERVLVVAV
jgi:porphobilinogen deaminase